MVTASIRLVVCHAAVITIVCVIVVGDATTIIIIDFVIVVTIGVAFINDASHVETRLRLSLKRDGWGRSRRSARRVVFSDICTWSLGGALVTVGRMMRAMVTLGNRGRLHVLRLDTVLGLGVAVINNYNFPALAGRSSLLRGEDGVCQEKASAVRDQVR